MTRLQDQNRQAVPERQYAPEVALLRFALVLAGDDHLAKRLVQLLDQKTGKGAGQNMSPSAWQFFQFKKLYDIWMEEAQKTPAVEGLFAPGHENEAIQKGLDPSIARTLGELPTLYRALLLLIYGEKFSYAATSQLLNISVEELMTALAAAQRKFRPEVGVHDSCPAPLSGIGTTSEVSHDTAR